MVGIIAFVVLIIVAANIGGERHDSAAPAPPMVDDQTLVCMNAWYWYSYKSESELTAQQRDLIGACRTLGRLTKSGTPEP